MDVELDDHAKTKGNSLSIRLTESAVFLSTDGHAHARRNSDQRSTLLRGLLILQLVKPTKIKSIELELTATASSAWPEGTLSRLQLFLFMSIILNLGIGARRIEITEEHRVFHATTLYFRASKSHAKRPASIGPGISYNSTDIDDDLNDWDVLSHTNDTTPSTASTSNSIPVSRSRSRSHPRSFFQNFPIPRRLSVDTPRYRRMSFDEPDDARSRLNNQQLPPIPPYSPFAPPVMTSDTSHFLTAHGVNTNLIHTVSSDRPPSSSVPSLVENSRHSPYASLRGSYILFSTHR
jgi:arrestin-related trafficking adapter 3/6